MALRAGALDERKRLRAIVHGRVQGVNFRYYTCEQARSLGLRGYVHNCDDGTVQVVAEGDTEQVQSLLRWLRKGPGLARVSLVEVSWQAPRHEFDDFEVRY